MDLTFELKQPVELVLNYLTDMQKFASVHPVITKIEKTGTDAYMVYEKMKLGFIPYSFTYPVTIGHNVEKGTVTMRAVVMKMTRIEMVFSVEPSENGSTVREHIEFRSPLPIRRTMEKVFREQHQKFFQNLDGLGI